MTDREPLLPGDWNELSPLLDQLLDADVSERPALLTKLSENNPARRAALERLLADCERAPDQLEQPAVERFGHLLGENEAPRLPDVLGGRYRIERELGRGGMARVYLAHDLRHARPVAVKVIRHEIASVLGRDRFLREIGIAARLRHPNIMPLFDSGDVDGLLYFVMPYEEGKSLRARLDRTPKLGVAEGVSILRDVARALAYAHEQGVVHRDVKPDNVLLSGDAAVVTDFGIAKAITIAATEAGAGTFTQAGTVIGTPAYMSPEQAIGDPATDHRADIYAFGCLAYELFAGTAPFTGATNHAILSAKLSESLKPLTDYRPDAPAPVARLIARCLENDPAARPSTAGELLNILGTMTAAGEPAVRAGRTVSKRLTAAITVVVMMLGIGYVAYATYGGPVSIVVLPLQVTGDSTQDLARGFTEDLSTVLMRVPWLSVVSRGGANNYRGLGDFDAKTIGDSLNARYVLMGSLRQESGRVSLTLQLISRERVTAWADKISGSNLKELRDRTVRSIADSLRLHAGWFAKNFPIDTTRQQYGTSDDAYRLYLGGKTKLAERGPGVGEGINRFRSALILDPNSAEAWSGLSLALAISAVSQYASVDSIRPEALKSAREALRLNNKLAEPHVAIGVIHALDWQWTEAEQEFKMALRIDPQDLESRIQYSRVLIAQGRLRAVHQQIDSALAADPVSSLALAFKGQAFAHEGALARAMTWNDQSRKVDPTNFVSRIFRAMLLVRGDRLAEARALVQNAPLTEPYALYVRARTGDSVVVRQQLAAFAAADNRYAATETARAYALLGLGDTAQALDALERATDRREIWPNISPVALPVFDAVRNNPRFLALRAKVGLPVP